jgi:hypothetical protein
VERFLRRFSRVLLTERAGSGVSRICEYRIATRRALLVHALEPFERHEHFAAYLDERRNVPALETRGDFRDRSKIRSHVLADASIAARRSGDEHAVAIRQ